MRTSYALVFSMLAGAGIGAGAIEAIHAQTEPPVYYIAEIEVTNLDGFLNEYAPRARANVRAFGGRVLAAGTNVATIEGDPPKPRVALLVWNSIETIQTWRSAPESREIQALGHKYAKFREFTVDGISQP
jgi:uncharacterized protein (DUF1330 family)